MLRLKIELAVDHYEHLEELSSYNHNYYRLHPRCARLAFPILLEEYDEDENYALYTLGDFDENGEFVEALTWDGEFGEGVEDILR